jgi:predicted nucleic acid-binding protein
VKALACLVDTNVLVRLAVPADPRHLSARRAVEALAGEGLCVASQNLVELWNVVTRPVENNGLGQAIPAADKILRRLEEAFPRLPDTPEVYDVWRGLVVRFGVSGVKVHDARLIALMIANGINQILTFNAGDFRRYEELGISVIEPGQI